MEARSETEADLPYVLVVDDVPENAELLLRVLRKLVKVEICHDVQSAIARLHDRRFLAVLTDQKMPGMSGVELLERVAYLSPQTTRILVTAYPTADVLTAAINRGHVEHIFAKPVHVAALRRLVERLVASESPSSSRRALVLAGPDLIETLRSVLESLGLGYDLSTSAAELRRSSTILSAVGYELVIWDTGIEAAPVETLGQLRVAASGAAVVCIVDRRGADPEIARLLKSGGVDDLVFRPVRADELETRIRRALENRRLADDRRRTIAPFGLRELLGRSSVMVDVFKTIEQVAPTNATLLIQGETGTGKELVARVAHSLSLRREMPFVTVNCAALPEGLVESELFGHERGAFTGAISRRAGRLESARGGTLFIDEIGDLPLGVQVKLLRTIQERKFERVGDNQTIKADIRIITATHRDLSAMIEQGTFREDLYYRLAVVPIMVPPLRERREDIWLLADYYLADVQRRMGKQGIRISEHIRQTLESYAWPGNVRELINVIERAVALTDSFGVVEDASFAAHLSSSRPRNQQRAEPAQEVAVKPEGQDRTLKEMVGNYERSLIVQMLERTGGNRTRAAKQLGLTRQGLSLKLTKYKI